MVNLKITTSQLDIRFNKSKRRDLKFRLIRFKLDRNVFTTPPLVTYLKRRYFL